MSRKSTPFYLKQNPKTMTTVINTNVRLQDDFFNLVVADFSRNRGIERTCLINLLNQIRKEGIILEYYSTQAETSDISKACAVSHNFHYNEKTMELRGTFASVKPFGRYFENLIYELGIIEIAVKGYYRYLGCKTNNQPTSIYTHVSGFRIVQSDIRHQQSKQKCKL